MSVQKGKILVVVGDVHAEIALAAEALGRLEEELGRPIEQVFSVGDFGLFLDEADWNWLSGPKHHRHPERSVAIAKAWAAWRWPLTMIGGNHEPFHKLRAFDPAAFGHKLAYRDAGELPHGLEGLRVVGLTGILHPDYLALTSAQDARRRSAPKPQSWNDMVDLVSCKEASLKRLTYYRQEEIDSLLALPPRPHLLLTHDWPVWPEGANVLREHRPERELLDALVPQFHCCGHWHRSASLALGSTQVRALNILSRHPHCVEPGWAAVFELGTEGSFREVVTWPAR